MDEQDELIGKIYEAALIPELWPDVIQTLADCTGCYGGSIYTSGVRYTAIAATPNCQEHLDDMISLGWAERNIRAQRVISQRINAFRADHDFCTEEEIRTHPIYTEFLRPRGLGWTVGTYIVGASGDFVVLSVDQQYEKGPIPSKVVSYLNGLRPHVARASALATRTRLGQEISTILQSDLLRIPAMLVRQNGSVIHVNRHFEGLEGEILIGTRDKILLKDGRANGLLQQLLTRPLGANSVQSIPLLRELDGVPFVLNVVPLKRHARDLFLGIDFIITVAPLSEAQGDLTELLSMLYDLTAAETRVVRNLCLGETIQSIATRYSVSPETARTQVKRILSKTNMSRQSELVASFSTLKLLQNGRDLKI